MEDRKKQTKTKSDSCCVELSYQRCFYLEGSKPRPLDKEKSHFQFVNQEECMSVSR